MGAQGSVEWVLALNLVGPDRLVATLGDRRWHSVAADGPWPPRAGAPALPEALRAALARVGAAPLSLQLVCALDAWPWERELADAGVAQGALPRFLVDLPEPRNATVPPLAMSMRAAPEGAVALAAAARALGRPLLLIDGALDAERSDALARRFRQHWRGTLPARQALAAALAELDLPHGACRLYGDDVPLDTRSDEGLRPVTALNIDLVASTPLVNAIGAERYAQRVLAYHKLCRDVIEPLQGALDNPQGDDGLMAYFGFPAALEDAASRALSAAWQLSRGVAELGLAARIGVASGQVAVNEQQAFGSDIHLAARLRAHAQPGQVLVAPSTEEKVALTGRFDLLACEATELDDFGIVAPFLLRGPAARAPAPPAPHEGSFAFVGRRREIEALRALWGRACGGRLQACTVQGEAGIGKSRLLREFVRELRDHGHRCLMLAGQSALSSSPFAVLLDGLRAHWSIDAAGTLADVRRRLAEVWPEDSADTQRLEVVARSLRPSSEADEADRPADWGEGLLEAVLACIGPGPCCVVVDDAHWLDPSSAELLRKLRQACADRPLLVVTAERTDAAPAPSVERGEPIALASLAAHDARSLADELGAALPPRLRQRVVERADGVPLFLVESLRVLRARPADALGEVPATLEDLLMVRLDDLGPDKELAQLLSLFGRECSASHARALLAQPDAFVERARRRGSLDSLLASRVVLPNDAPQPGYRFSHALLRDAAYASIGTHDRRRLHGLCADLIERETPGLARQRPESVAFHLDAAGRPDDARRAWSEAAQLAAARGAHQETVDLAQRALALHGPAGDDVALARSAIRLHLLVASASIALHGYGSAAVEAAYRAAEQAGSRLADSTLAQRVRLGLEACYVMRGDLERAGELAEAAVESTHWSLDTRLALHARWARANVCFHRGDWPAALAGFDDCLAHYRPALHRPSGVQDVAVMCLGYSSWLHFELGQADEALARIDRMMDLAQSLQHPFSLGVAHGFAASVKRLAGDSAAAWPHAEDAVRVCERGGFEVWLAHAWMVRGQLRSDRGDIDGGAADMERGYRLWTDGGARISCAVYLTTRAEILLRQRRTDEAAAQLGLAQRIGEQIGETYYDAERERLQGLCAWQAGDEARAAVLLGQALARAQAQGKPGLALRCALSLGAWEAAHGRFEPAAGRIGALLDGLTQHGCRDTRWSRHARQCWQSGRAFASDPATPWEPR